MVLEKLMAMRVVKVAVVQDPRFFCARANEVDVWNIFEGFANVAQKVSMHDRWNNGQGSAGINDSEQRLLAIGVHKRQVTIRKSASLDAPKEGGIQFTFGHLHRHYPVFSPNDLGCIVSSKNGIAGFVCVILLELPGRVVIGVAKAYYAILNETSCFELLEERMSGIILR